MPFETFQGKVVVITGGATGIGFSFAKQFGCEGAKIVIAARREDRLRDAVEKLNALEIDACYCVCDMTVRSQVESLANFVEARYGSTDFLLNSAGVGPKRKPILTLTANEFQDTMNINVLGVLQGMQVFGKRMLEQKKPCAIYNMGSGACFIDGGARTSDYVASKHALHALTNAFRHEVTASFMTVGLICAGIVNSELAGGITNGMPTDDFTALVLPQIKAGNYYVVSHPHHRSYVEARYEAIKAAYVTYAPRYKGDEKYDTKKMIQAGSLYPEDKSSSSEEQYKPTVTGMDSLAFWPTPPKTLVATQEGATRRDGETATADTLKK